MSKNLVIVESPAKAKTISGYLGSDYIVKSSVGHVRDLPSSAKQVPEKYKKEKWGNLGVNVEENFEPIYIVNDNRKDVIKDLKNRLKTTEKLYLATDEDREGEAIAWHLLEVLKPSNSVEVYRMVFHEITKDAIEEAVKSPRKINQDLVNAQEARRILDRLYGYEVSPVLWKKIATKLSAGRVQSVVKKLLVDREKQRMSFISAKFAELKVELKVEPKEGAQSNAQSNEGQDGDSPSNASSWNATLEEIDSNKVAQANDFDTSGELAKKDLVHLDLETAKTLGEGIGSLKIAAKKSRPYLRRPQPPLTTSDLQQTAGNRLGMSSGIIMSAAQQLYEKGYITYMRTDANNLSKAAIKTTREQIGTEFGSEFLSPDVRSYKNKAKNVQEAHEAIRPTGETFITPAKMRTLVPSALADIYTIIYERTLASQMTDEVGETTTYQISCQSGDKQLLFRVGGTVITHAGFRKAVVLKSEDTKSDVILPQMQEGDNLEKVSANPAEKETRPPSRYSEASLVAKLEELGVGRPSTYASTIKTVLNRGYAWKRGSQIIPTFTAFAVVQLLEKHFPDLVDSNFTARLEDVLDEISLGETKSTEWLREFYLGDEDSKGLQIKVEEELEKIDPRAVSTIPLGKDSNGEAIDVRVGRYGPFISRDEDTASIPSDVPPDEMTIEKALEILNTPSHQEIGKDPATGMTVLGLRGRFGPYLRIGTEEELKENNTDIKDAKTSSLFSSMQLGEVALDQAIELLSLPRVVGQHEDVDVIATNGPFGPYIKHGRESRNLGSEEELLTITLEECIHLLSKPKKFGRTKSATSLRALGDDPMTDKAISVKNGRFGFYVTDGEVNASLRDTDDPQEITADRASELLASRREKMEAEGTSPKKKTTATRSRSKTQSRRKSPAKRKMV